MIALPLLRDGRAAETELPLLGGPPDLSSSSEVHARGLQKRRAKGLCPVFKKTQVV